MGHTNIHCLSFKYQLDNVILNSNKGKFVMKRMLSEDQKVYLDK